ncbi:MAG: hypothetical protein JWO36_5743 [Myxococcales bacterium]|nr:hypothetical protein [Myxococcales bacterium]
MIFIALIIAVVGLLAIMARDSVASAIYRFQLPALRLLFGRDLERRRPNELERYRRWVVIAGGFLIAFAVGVAVQR